MMSWARRRWRLVRQNEAAKKRQLFCSETNSKGKVGRVQRSSRLGKKKLFTIARNCNPVVTMEKMSLYNQNCVMIINGRNQSGG
jgi:hypothetical protein